MSKRSGRSASRPLRIGFDARLAGPKHAGIGRYSEQLLQRLLTQLTLADGDQAVQWVVFVHPDHGMIGLDELAAADHVEVRETTIRHYSWQEQSHWLRELNSAALDWLHVPHFNVPLLYRQPFSVTIHDLLWHKHRDPHATTLTPAVHAVKRVGYELVSESAIKRAKVVFVPSQFVKADVYRQTGRDLDVHVTPEGVGDPYRSVPLVQSGEEKRSRRKKERAPYFVYTGSLYPHKNVEVVLRALRLLPAFRLKVASARNVFTDRVMETARRFGVQHQIDWLGFVPDEELIRQYQGAVALVQPSLAEGFGLTGLEALAVGCPAVLSDIKVFREIFSESGWYFPRLDGKQLAETLLHLEKSPPKPALRRQWQQFARSYDWDHMAQQTWEEMSTAITKVTPLGP